MKVPDALIQVGFGEHALGRRDDVAEREQQFCALVERHSRLMFRVAYALLRNASDSEDVVQEVYLKLYRSGAWTQIDNERAFLAKAVWRMAATRRAKSRNDAISEQEIASNSQSPEENAISEDWSGVVGRMIDSLPEELRQPLALSTVDELTSGAIAEVMGIPEGTVRTRLMRARKILRQKLEAIGSGSYGKR